MDFARSNCQLESYIVRLNSLPFRPSSLSVGRVSPATLAHYRPFHPIPLHPPQTARETIRLLVRPSVRPSTYHPWTFPHSPTLADGCQQRFSRVEKSLSHRDSWDEEKYKRRPAEKSLNEFRMSQHRRRTTFGASPTGVFFLPCTRGLLAPSLSPIDRINRPDDDDDG